MADYDLELLSKAIAKARNKAMEFSNVPDGGSCNMDEAYIYVPGMREATARKLGCRILKSRLFGRLLMIGGTLGQGNRCTAMAEAAAKSLKEDGLSAGVWYQVD